MFRNVLEKLEVALVSVINPARCTYAFMEAKIYRVQILVLAVYDLYASQPPFPTEPSSFDFKLRIAINLNSIQMV